MYEKTPFRFRPLRDEIVSTNGELVHRGLSVRSARPEYRVRKRRPGRGIGKMLGLEAESGVPPVTDAPFSGERTVQEITRVELDPRLRGEDLHESPAGRIVELRHGAGEIVRVVQHPVVVVPSRKDRKSTRLNSSHGYISYA